MRDRRRVVDDEMDAEDVFVSARRAAGAAVSPRPDHRDDAARPDRHGPGGAAPPPAHSAPARSAAARDHDRGWRRLLRAADREDRHRGSDPVEPASSRRTSACRAWPCASGGRSASGWRWSASSCWPPSSAAIAIAIRLDSPGPVLFVQERVGRAGRRFLLLKFRTMFVTDAAHSEWARDNADRITRVGRWLRRFRLDELPQFVNVLRGDMDLVGPRPHPVLELLAVRDRAAQLARVRRADPVLLDSLHGAARHHGLGPGSLPVREQPGRGDREDALRPVLREAPLALARSPDPRRHGEDGAGRTGVARCRAGAATRPTAVSRRRLQVVAEAAMKPALLDILVCPACQKALDLRADVRKGLEVLEGALRCPGCARDYPIVVRRAEVRRQRGVCVELRAAVALVPQGPDRLDERHRRVGADARRDHRMERRGLPRTARARRGGRGRAVRGDRLQQGRQRWWAWT